MFEKRQRKYSSNIIQIFDGKAILIYFEECFEKCVSAFFYCALSVVSVVLFYLFKFEIVVALVIAN